MNYKNYRPLSALRLALLFLPLLMNSFSSKAQIITTIAGTSTYGYTGDGGPATLAELNAPSALNTDRYGNVYVCDQGNNVVRKITPAGIITTVVGNGFWMYTGDGVPATSTGISPFGIVVDTLGNIYVSDNSNARVRKVDAVTGIITTYAGGGFSCPGCGPAGDGGPASAAALNSPEGLAIDKYGNMYIADYDGHEVRKVNPAGIISTVAGNYFFGGGYSGDGGPATAADIGFPSDVAIDAAGNVLITDVNNYVIRKVDPSGIIHTFAGISYGPTSPTIGAPATAAYLGIPLALRVDAANNVYYTTEFGELICKIDTSGILTAYAGILGSSGFYGDGGPATAAELSFPWGIAFDAAGNLFLGDADNQRVRKIGSATITISGITSICQGTTTTLSSSVTGGTWSSGSTAIATVGSATGIVTGVSSGVATITYSASGSTGTASVTVNALPSAYAVTGGASCSGSVTVGLTGSQAGVNYKLTRGTTLVSTLPGTGVAISFGLETVVGIYKVTAVNTTTGCTEAMTDSAVVGSGGYPAVVAVTGGGSTCAGTVGVLVGLAGSAVGVNYQLYRGGVPVGAPVPGVGSSLSFGPQTVAGTYTVIATSATGCSSTMLGSAIVTVYPAPASYTVTGGGTLCSGGAGVAVGLSGSTSAISYRLYRGTTPVGAAVSGSGAAISFGAQTVAGTYTVIATNTTTSCAATMTGSATVVVNPSPAVEIVTGGGGYCAGGAGVVVGLSGSSIGVNYQLFRSGVAVGLPVAGTGAALSFGLQTVAGTYTVVATNVTTSCSGNMSGSATVTINPLPTVYVVTGGGAYCSGGTGSIVGLSGSQTGVTYSLYRGGVAVAGPVSGTGVAISFGAQTIAGTYTVVATNIATTCTSNMTGSATVSVNVLPNVYTVTGGGTGCSGLGSHIMLSNSDVGISYRLYLGTVAVGTAMSGTGTVLDFGVFTTAGTYTAVATNVSTGCTSNMAGDAIITTGTLPYLFIVTGGGGYCAGGTGVTIGLSGTTGLVSYQLYNGTSPVGAPIIGAGAPISFGLQTIPGTYTVIATSTVSGCTRTMAGTAVVTINPLPTVYTVTGGGAYCAGGTGVAVGVSGSNTGISYRLYRSGSLISTTPGSGVALSFGLETVAGTYTVVAVNTGTSCTSNMSGSAVVTINPIPTITGSIYTVAPGSSITLTGSPAGGTWASSTTPIATVGSSTGIVTGVALGTTTITYTSPAVCRTTHNVAVTLTGHRDEPTVVSAPEQSAEIAVMPNPTTGTFVIKGAINTPGNSEVSYEVMNMLGKIIYKGTTTAQAGLLEETVQLGNVAKGIYLLNVHTASETKTFRIVVN